MYRTPVVILISLVAYATSHGHHDGVSSYPTAKHGPVGYHGHLAKPLVLKDGHIADTHEVAAARSAHFAALAKAPQGHDEGHDGGHGGYDGGYGGGYGGGFGGADGHGHFSFGPGTHDIYKGEHGYAGLHSVDHGQEHGYVGAGHDGAVAGGGHGGYGGGHGAGNEDGFGGAHEHGHLSYGPGTHDVYKGEHGYAGLHSVHHGQEHGHHH